MIDNTIHIINLIDRIDRRDHIIKEFKEQGIKSYEFWPGVKHEMPFVGISRAHKAIVRDAKRNGRLYTIISEDDCQFADVGAYQYFIDNMPDEFDLYLSSIYWGQIKEDNTVEDFSSLTFYIIHSRYYDAFLETLEPQHIDRGQKGKGKFVVCTPFTTFQIDGYSDNVQHDTSDYFSKYMSQRKFFSNALHANVQ